MRIRARLLVVVFGVWLAAAAGFGLLTWNLHQQKAAADLQQVEEYAEGINRLVERELDKRIVLARTLASTRAVREGDFARFHEEASAATQGSDNWALVIEPDTIRAHTLKPYDGEALARLQPRSLVETGVAFLYVPKGRVFPRGVITVAVPVPGFSPQKYNVGVAFEASSVQKLLSVGNPPAQTMTSVVDDQQAIMARSRDPERWVGRSASVQFKQRILSGGVGFAESTTLDGMPSLTYLTPPNAYGWSVVVAIPRAQLTAAAWAASRKALGASGVLLLLLLLAALYGAQALSASAERLSRAAADLGNNQVPEPMQSGVREFDDVAAALHAAGVKAREATRVLEERVNEAVRSEADAQAKLLQGQKLELVGRLTAGVAHDFNNLLQTITTAHQVLKPHLPDERQQKMLSAAVRATSKAADLVRQMMMLGRSHGLAPTSVNLADAVLKGHELTSKAVGQGVTLTAAIEPDVPPVFVDATQLEVALLNLVFNARDAMPRGGEIHITARQAGPGETAGLADGAYVCLEVSDNGAGMSPETVQRALEPFFTTKPVGAGTGLGLAQVHAFAVHSGGSITLHSEPGQGTQVRLYLPVAPGDEAAPQRASVAPAPDGGTAPLRVLMVEDDVLVASVVASALRAQGHQVRCCHTADEAMRALLTDEPFDVLFTDVVMPGGMSGVELVAWAHAQRPGLAALAATGYADNLNQLDVPVLRKPYDMQTLLQALAELGRRTGG